MSASVDVSKVTVTFASSPVIEPIDLNVDIPGIEIRDTFNFDSAAPATGVIGNATHVPGRRVDAGTVSMQAHLNPDNIPAVGSQGTLTIGFAASGGDSIGANWSGNATLTNFSASAPLDDKMVWDLEFKWDGGFTITGGTT